MKSNLLDFRLFLAAGIAGAAVVLGAWSFLEGTWFEQAPPEVQRYLDALRGALATLLVLWVSILVMQRMAGRAATAEAKRQQLEQELDRFFQLSIDMLCIAGTDGYFKRLNPGWQSILGYRIEALLAEPLLNFVHPDDRATTTAEFEKLLAGGTTIQFENRYCCQDGSYRWLVWNAIPLLDQERIYAVAHDITERKHAEEALWRTATDLAHSNQQLRQFTADLEELGLSRQRAYRELETAYHDLKRAESQLVQAEKLSALGQMVAGVAHEINNPLSFVTNNVAVLQRDVVDLHEMFRLYQQAEPCLAEHRPELLEQIHVFVQRSALDYTVENLERLVQRTSEGLKRIHQIVKDLRNFARVDEGDLNTIDLNEGVRSTATIIAGRAKQQGVTLELDLTALPRVTCYPGKVNQVVLNLVSNAIDACSPGGKVTVRTRASAGGVQIEVDDTGHGIDPAIRNRIFDPFFTTKPLGQGTGLGLSISYGIIQSHGGRIDVESTPGQGARFHVWLPLIPAVPVHPLGRPVEVEKPAVG